MKKLISVLIVLSMLVGMLSAQVLACGDTYISPDPNATPVPTGIIDPNATPVPTLERTPTPDCVPSLPPADANGFVIVDGVLLAYEGTAKVVTIPDSVTSIGSNAFSNHGGLTNVTIPNSVTSIGGSAFSNCVELTSVNIPNSVTSIGDHAFYICSALTTMTIPYSVISIGYGIFTRCTALTQIIVESNNSSYLSQDGVLFDKTKTTLIRYPSAKTGSYSIPDSVTSIIGQAFYDCTGLTSIAISKNVTSIDNDTFHNCTGLTSINIPSNVTSIGGDAFHDCTGLTSVTFGNGLTNIEAWAFGNCPKLTSIIIPDNVISIGAYAFRECSGLSSVTIGNNVTSIGYGVFYDCSSLSSITIGSKVNYIDSYVFFGCIKLTQINVDVNNLSYSSQDGVLFNKTKTSLIIFPEGKSGSYVIPGSVISIIEYAFFTCAELTSVTIPDSVTNIGVNAFRNCPALTSVNIGNRVVNIGDSVFSGCTRLTSVIIPDSVISMGDYVLNNCTGLTNVTIGNSVTSIGIDVFSGCTGLTSVTIPNSVTSIGYQAFARCTGLTTAIFLGNAPSISTRVFYNCSPTFTIYYYSNKFGFSSPRWNGYQSAAITPSTPPTSTLQPTSPLPTDTPTPTMTPTPTVTQTPTLFVTGTPTATRKIDPTPSNQRPISNQEYTDKNIPADIKDATKYTGFDVVEDQNNLYGTSIYYSGNWVEGPITEGHFYDHYRTTSTKNDYVEFTFTGNYLNVYSAIDPGFSHRATFQIWQKNSSGIWIDYAPYNQVRLNFELPQEGEVVVFDPGKLPYGEYKVRLTQSCIYPLYFEGFRFWQEVVPTPSPTEPPTPTPSPTEPPIPTPIFPDIDNPEFSWAKESIVFLARENVIAGSMGEDGIIYYLPGNNVTRAEFCSLIVRAFGFELSGTPKEFTDMQGFDWAISSVDIASSLDIVKGYPNGTFKPDAPISRQELAVMISRAMNVANFGNKVKEDEVEANLSVFNDQAEIESWAREGVAFAAKNGIVVGNPDGSEFRFAPIANANRAETAVIVKRAYMYMFLDGE